MIEDKQGLICIKCNLLYLDLTLKECPRCNEKLTRRGIQIITKKVKKNEKDILDLPDAS